MFERVFLDGNIFIDLNDEVRDPKKNSLKILDFLVSSNIKIYTSCDLITTIYYMLYKRDRLQALSRIEEINKFCKIIEFSNKDVEKTCNLMRENESFKDLEDTLQYVMAEKEGCDAIISNDSNFFSKEIPLYTSRNFCERYIDNGKK